VDIKKLSLEEKIGQRFMFGVNSYNIDIIIELIKNYSIGGVILYKKNYNSYSEMLSVVKRLKDANKNNKIPLFISIDQEGGRVNRFPSEFVNLKNVYDVSKKDEKLIYECGDITGKILSAVGINMNFAPVMDMYNNKGKILYNRCFFGNADDVSRVSMFYVKGLNNNGIISVPKHFPGHGISMMDSHFITPYVFNFKEVIAKHVKPFKNAIDNGIDSIMVNHLVIRKLTGLLPASISSKFIQKYIRDNLKFNGVVITDEINMLSRNIFYKFIYMKKAMLSGCDIILIRTKDDGIKIIEKYRQLLNNVDNLKLLDDSVERIINLKKKYKISDDVTYINLDIEEINKRIIELNNKVNA